MNRPLSYVLALGIVALLNLEIFGCEPLVNSVSQLTDLTIVAL